VIQAVKEKYRALTCMPERYGMMGEIVGETGMGERDGPAAAPAPYSKRIGQRPCPVFRLCRCLLVSTCRPGGVKEVVEEEEYEEGTYQSHGHTSDEFTTRYSNLPLRHALAPSCSLSFDPSSLLGWDSRALAPAGPHPIFG
jgi:hypothetical protein